MGAAVVTAERAEKQFLLLNDDTFLLYLTGSSLLSWMTTEQETGNKKQKWSYPETWWFLPGWEVVTKTLDLGLRIKTEF